MGGGAKVELEEKPSFIENTWGSSKNRRKTWALDSEAVASRTGPGTWAGAVVSSVMELLRLFLFFHVLQKKHPMAHLVPHAHTPLVDGLAATPSQSACTGDKLVPKGKTKCGSQRKGEGVLDGLNQLCKGHPQTSSVWELVRIADSLAEPQTYWVRISGDGSQESAL